jgi:hypothetical protein
LKKKNENGFVVYIKKNKRIKIEGEGDATKIYLALFIQHHCSSNIIVHPTSFRDKML